MDTQTQTATLLDWLTKGEAPTCAVKNVREGGVLDTVAYLIRTQSGAEHGYVNVVCWYRLSYETVSTILDEYPGSTLVEFP